MKISRVHRGMPLRHAFFLTIYFASHLPLISLACSYDDYVVLFTPWLFHLIKGGSFVPFIPSPSVSCIDDSPPFLFRFFLVFCLCVNVVLYARSSCMCQSVSS